MKILARPLVVLLLQLASEFPFPVLPGETVWERRAFLLAVEVL